MAKETKLTVREFTCVEDIKNNFLYRTDGYILCYLKVYFYNLDLLTREERRSKSQALAASFEGDKKDFVYFTLPREIDLDQYKNQLNTRYKSELTSLGRRHILSEMILGASEMSTSGENFEHQHFIKIWIHKEKDKKGAEIELLNRMNEFQERYESVGIRTEILEEVEIIKLCNLFGNATQASYEIVDKNTIYNPITQIR